MELGSIWAVSATVIAGALTLLWLVSLPLKNVSIIDLFWGCGFVLIGWIGFLLGNGDSPRNLLVAVLTTIWGLRLAGYLTWRNWGESEDYRYRAMRASRGAAFAWISLFLVFGLQGVIMLIVALPVLVSVTSTTPLGAVDAAGVLLWGTGLFFEAIGDWQLARFKSRPENHGKVLDRGLWRYTRHPNYFGDFLVWWGLYLLAITAGGAWTVFSPLLMSLLLLKVSGVTLLEKSLHERRPAYADYVRRTSPFFPWPPRHVESESKQGTG